MSRSDIPADPNRRGQSFVEYTQSLAGRKILKAALSYAGEMEDPVNSNRGTNIDRWQRNLGYSPPVAWCACYANSMHQEAGYNSPVRTGSVADMYLAAQQAGIVSRVPYPGCFVVIVTLLSDGKTLDESATDRGGHHVELFVRWHNKPRNIAVTIGGNTPNLAGTNAGVVFHYMDTDTPTQSKPERTTRFIVPQYLRKVRRDGPSDMPVPLIKNPNLSRRTPR